MLGVTFAACGLLPAEQVQDTWHRVAPLLVFLAAVVVLAELTAGAEVFDVVAARMAIFGRGRYVVLFVLCVGLASACTMVLNLDTTAVLLTPVLLARQPGGHRVDVAGDDHGVVVTMVALWGFFWRRGARGPPSYALAAPHVPRNRLLFRAACAACACFVAGVLADLPLNVVALLCTALLVAVHVFADRTRLRWGLIPWRLLAMVPGLFLVVGTVSAHGLEDVMGALAGDDADTAGAVRTAATGAVMANLVNNLPAYLAGEAVGGHGGPGLVLALLVGVNAGPMITPWGSLATLIWFERCHAHGVRIRLRTFAFTGAVVSVLAVVTTTGALIVTASVMD